MALRTAKQIAVTIFGATTEEEIKAQTKRINAAYNRGLLAGAGSGGRIYYDPEDPFFKPKLKFKPIKPTRKGHFFERQICSKRRSG